MSVILLSIVFNCANHWDVLNFLLLLNRFKVLNHLQLLLLLWSLCKLLHRNQLLLWLLLDFRDFVKFFEIVKFIIHSAAGLVEAVVVVLLDLLLFDFFGGPQLLTDCVLYVHVVRRLLQLDPTCCVIDLVLLLSLLVDEGVILIGSIVPTVELHLLQTQSASICERRLLDRACPKQIGLLPIVLLLLRKLNLPQQLILLYVLLVHHVCTPLGKVKTIHKIPTLLTIQKLQITICIKKVDFSIRRLTDSGTRTTR